MRTPLEMFDACWAADSGYVNTDWYQLIRPALVEHQAAMEVVQMVDQWGNGLRHRTAHESKMVNAARVILKQKQDPEMVLVSKKELEDLRDKAWRYDECSK